MKIKTITFLQVRTFYLLLLSIESVYSFCLFDLLLYVHSKQLGLRRVGSVYSDKSSKMQDITTAV